MLLRMLATGLVKLLTPVAPVVARVMERGKRVWEFGMLTTWPALGSGSVSNKVWRGAVKSLGLGRASERVELVRASP